MLITEDEAKTKECPYKPMAYTTPGNAGEPVPQWTGFDVCSRSECMAWRWNAEQAMPRRIMHYYSQETKEPDRRPEGVPKGWGFRPCIYHATRYEPAYWFEPKEMHEERIKNQLPLRGYCGLAGRPE